MIEIKSVWGGVLGKIIASLLVIGALCGVLALTLYFAVNGDVLLNKDEIKVSDSVDKVNNNVTVKFRVEKQGFYLSDIKTEKSGDKLMVKLYASVKGSEKYKADDLGNYAVDFKFDSEINSIVQEGDDGDEYTLVVLNHKS